jgi:4-hydroxybenzoate polyprenyltransferase
MNLTTALRLGRVSNLPTVWTNALTGALLAGGAPAEKIFLAAVALSGFYIGGMWLNDAFDSKLDAVERPSRPIPSGAAQRQTVFAVGFALLLFGVLLSFVISPKAGNVGLFLAATIIAYDALHKATGLAPLIMALTRFLAYCLGAYAAGIITNPVLWGGMGLFAYVAGLTYAARGEAVNQIERIWPLIVLSIPVAIALAWTVVSPVATPFLFGLLILLFFALQRLIRREKGDIPVAVVSLIAGITLYDAVLIAATSESVLYGLLAVVAFALTLSLQRVVPGT